MKTSRFRKPICNIVKHSVPAFATALFAAITLVTSAQQVLFDFNDGLQTWTKIYPAGHYAEDTLWSAGALGEGHDHGATRFGRSPEFYLDGSGDLTFQLRGGESPLAAPDLPPAQIPASSIDNGGFAGVALRDVADDIYIMSKRRTGNDNTVWQANSFTAAELAPYANNGKRYTLDYIDYNRGTWGWTYLDNVSLPAKMVEVNMYSVTLEPFSPAHIAGNNITLRVSHGTDVSSLAPTCKFIPPSPAATCSPASGSTQDFSTGPIAYTLVSADLTVTNIYSMRVEVMPSPSTALVGQWVSCYDHLKDTSGYTLAGTHDGTVVGEVANLTYSPDTPPGFGGSSLDLRAGAVGVRIDNTKTSDPVYANTFDEGISNQFTVAFWAKGMPETWAPWVSKRGESGIGWQLRRMEDLPVAGFTIRGIENNFDGLGSPVNVNDSPAVWHHFAGVWNQKDGTRNLYVDGVLSHVVYNDPSQIMALAPQKALAIGARADGGNWYENYFSGLIYDVRIYNQALLANEVEVVMTTPTTQQPPESFLKIQSYGVAGWQATISTERRTISWVVPFDSDLTALRPEFTLSNGATCNRISGERVDFTQPQSYAVTSADEQLTVVYTAKVYTVFDFNDSTLQGWNNRVWDLNAGSGSGGWVDMEPDHIIMPEAINGGVIQPPSGSNYLFGATNKFVEAYPKGLSSSDDYHENTLWLRSPEFYLNSIGDLTVELAGGYARDAAPINAQAVPVQASYSGWMGVVLRRVSDGEFVITKPAVRLGGSGSGTYRTTTFTQAELAPYAGSKAYTLELISTHQGEWGWLKMDNIRIPGSSVPVPAVGMIILIR